MTSRNWLTLFKQFSSEFSSVGFFTSDGSPLLMKSQFSPDFATLGEALSVVRKTLNPKFPQICALNDPQFGGALLTSCTFVVQLGKEPASPWMVCRSPSRSLPQLKKVWSEESLKLPPLPLPQSLEEQLSFLSGITQHPMAPVSWKTDLPQMLNSINTLQEKWEKNFSKQWSKSASEVLQKETQTWIQKKLDTASNLEVEEKLTATTQIKSLKSLCLKVKVHLEKSVISIDCSGTSVAELGLPSSWVQGIVIGSLNQFLKSKNPEIVFGNFASRLHLVTPTRSLVNQTQLSGSQGQWLVFTSALTSVLNPVFHRLFSQEKTESDKQLEKTHLVMQLSNPVQTFLVSLYESSFDLEGPGKLIRCEKTESGSNKRSWQILKNCKLQSWFLVKADQKLTFELNSKEIALSEDPLELKEGDLISFG